MLSDPLNFLIFVSGFAFLLKKVADMDRYQTLRTIVLTAIIGFIVIYFFLAFVPLFTFGPFEPVDCPDEHYCMTEV